MKMDENDSISINGTRKLGDGPITFSKQETETETLPESEAREEIEKTETYTGSGSGA